MFVFAGDISSRLWICPEHGKSGFRNIERLIHNYSFEHNIVYDTSWDIANRLLARLTENKYKSGDIYFCEDYFEKDLKEWYDKLSNILDMFNAPMNSVFE
jgi:hypothetical protein